MATLIETLKTDALKARMDRTSPVSGVTAVLLVTLVGEAAMIGKNDGDRAPTDIEVTGTIKKFLKGIDEVIATLAKIQTEQLTEKQVKQLAEAHIEKSVLEGYQPKQLSTDELKAVIEGIVAALPDKNAKAMGAVMKTLKDTYGGTYDGTSASALVKAALA